MKVKITEYNTHNGAIRWRMLISLKSHMTHFFATALTVFEMITFQIWDPENLGQGHEVKHSQWSRSMAQINLYKRSNGALIVFEIFKC